MTQKQHFIEIKMRRYTLLLTEIEMQNLLSPNPILWQEGIKRGKGILRAKTARARIGKLPAREGRR